VVLHQKAENRGEREKSIGATRRRDSQLKDLYERKKRERETETFTLNRNPPISNSCYGEDSDISTQQRHLIAIRES
jgi:2-iminoacetate synthase ThiH